MRIGRSFAVGAAVATVISTQAEALDVIYKVSGVTDSGGAINTGVATRSLGHRFDHMAVA